MSFDYEDEYKLLRRLVVKGQITAAEAKTWLVDKEKQIVEKQMERVKRFGTNCYREGKLLSEALGLGEESDE